MRALAFGHVDVRYRASSGAAARSAAVLSDDERDRAARFVFEHDRESFVAAHVLLREALSDHAGVAPAAWTFATGPQGKPVLSDAHAGVDLDFNLTHTRGLVACAIGRGARVGIDVERIGERLDSLDLARRFFSRREAAALEACPAAERPVRFIEIWTLKEAYIKAIGEGLSHPLETFGFTLEGASGLVFEPPSGEDAAAWAFGLFAPTPVHRMALAVGPPAGRPAGPVIATKRVPMYTCAAQPLRLTRTTSSGGFDE